MSKLIPRINRKRSYVWEHFSVFEEDNRKAICDHCNAHVHRGTTARTFSTTPLICHLKRCKRKLKSKDPGSSAKKHRYSLNKPNINATILIDRDPANNDDDWDEEYDPQQLVHTPTHSGHPFRLTNDEHASYTPQKSNTPSNSMVNPFRLTDNDNAPYTPQKSNTPSNSMVQMSRVSFTPSRSDNYVSPDPRYDITDDVIQSKRMDLVHSGLLMHTLYQQHRSGMFCDLSLIVTRKSTTSLTVAHNESIHASLNKTGKKTFKAHSSVLSALSSKVKTLVEMGSSSLEMKDVTPFGIRSLLEIVYTGKLKLQSSLKFHQAKEIWKAASDLGINYVQDYLVNEHPQVAGWINELTQNPTNDQDNFDDANDDLRDLCAPSIGESVVEQIVDEIAGSAELGPPSLKTEEFVEDDHENNDQLTDSNFN